MRLSEIKTELKKLSQIAFQLPDGELVPSHFHITEVAKITKYFIDCGGVVRIEEVANFQLWEANDFDHRLHSEKIIQIIEQSEEKLQISDLEIEVEYQMKETIGKFNLKFDGTKFQLVSKLTDCLSKDKCGIPPEKLNVKIGDWKLKENSCCTSNSNYC